jgi:hypothetical protein
MVVLTQGTISSRCQADSKGVGRRRNVQVLSLLGAVAECVQDQNELWGVQKVMLLQRQCIRAFLFGV